MEAASKHLTPVTLELGGKSPVIVDKKININLATKRIIWGKILNSGQNCISPDYILVHKDRHTELIKSFQSNLKSFFPQGSENSKDYSRIINERHFDRLMNYLKEIPSQNIIGGKNDREQKFIEPTLILDPPLNSKLMEEEIFGPLLPIRTYSDLQEAIDFINDRPKPLAIYVFSNDKKVQDYVLKHTSSGAVIMNDVLLHYVCHDLPFGGVGESGFGAYHGYSSFKTFSHEKSVLNKATWIDPDIRYPPFTPSKTKMLTKPIKLNLSVIFYWIKLASSSTLVLLFIWLLTKYNIISFFPPK
jgi:aldehyde dehydrogenase (NAD+)